MYKQRSKVVATYSKRKQFRRIIRDNWLELENSSTNPCGDEEISLKPLTSTPLGKTYFPAALIKDCTPLNLLQSGSFDTPYDDKDLLKDICHPRELSGKRVCRRPPTSPTISTNKSTSPQATASPIYGSQFTVDSQVDLFFTSKSELHVDDVVKTSEPLVDEVVNISEPHVDEVVKISEPLVDEVVYISELLVDDVVQISEPHVDGTTKLSEHHIEISADVTANITDEAEQLSMEVSKMSIQEGKVSVLENSKKEGEESLMEISIEECINAQKIAVLDRNLMLTQALPSFKKLLSQCRRVKDLETMVIHEHGIRKIGEGTFGEVFMGHDTVYKVVPVGGHIEINDAEQTSFENAFQEIVVSRKLSDLAGDEVQMGKAFCQLKDVVLCEGKYPSVLLDAWDDFKGTENERPDRLPSDQLYVVLLARYSGIQLEEYCTQHKLSPDQAHSIIRQICCSLAAAEQKYEFEHRDLHWGNVLISDTSMEHVEFTQDGKTFILRSHGLLATIIDFTFSRLETEGCLNFVDLEQEEWLFEGDVKVDIQYRVYRDMRSACRKNWAKFTPKTNVLWILYLIDKMNVKIKSQKLRRLKQALQSCKSASMALPIAFRSL